jgi:hypothetical protein
MATGAGLGASNCGNTERVHAFHSVMIHHIYMRCLCVFETVLLHAVL